MSVCEGFIVMRKSIRLYLFPNPKHDYHSQWTSLEELVPISWVIFDWRENKPMAVSFISTTAARSFTVIDPSLGIFSKVSVSTKRWRAAMRFAYGTLAWVLIQTSIFIAEAYVFTLSHQNIKWLLKQKSKFVNFFEQLSMNLMVAIKALKCDWNFIRSLR